ncbi:Abnormal pharyngeal pumping eat-20, partial [Stegodyphus mimosarum]
MVKCECFEPYSGSRCEIDPCSQHPCENGGVCKINDSNYFCECPGNF